MLTSKAIKSRQEVEIMDRLKRLTRAIHTISLTASVLVAELGASWVVEHFQDENDRYDRHLLPLVVAVVIVIYASHTIQDLLEFLLESSTRLRRRLLGRQYIEGTWFVIFLVNEKPRSFGITRIELAGTSVQFSGEDFLVGKEGRGHYLTDFTLLDWPKLKYKYTYQVSDSREISHQGYGEAQFLGVDGSSPLEFEGFFFELIEGQRVTFIGRRVDSDQMKQVNDNPRARRATVENYFTQIGMLPEKRTKEPLDFDLGTSDKVDFPSFVSRLLGGVWFFLALIVSLSGGRKTQPVHRSPKRNSGA
jgi:hypothetical protein